MLIAATNFAARSACTALGSKPAGRTMGQTDGRTPDRYVDPAPHTLPAFAAVRRCRCRSISPARTALSSKPAARFCCDRMMGQADGQTDGRTPDRYLDPAAHATRAVPVTENYLSVGIKKKGKGRSYSITERRVPEMIPFLCSQPAGDVSHKPGGRLPLLSARPAVTPATLKRAATNLPISLLDQQRHDGCEQFA